MRFDCRTTGVERQVTITHQSGRRTSSTSTKLPVSGQAAASAQSSAVAAGYRTRGSSVHRFRPPLSQDPERCVRLISLERQPPKPGLEVGSVAPKHHPGTAPPRRGQLVRSTPTIQLAALRRADGAYIQGRLGLLPRDADRRSGRGRPGEAPARIPRGTRQHPGCGERRSTSTPRGARQCRTGAAWRRARDRAPGRPECPRPGDRE